MIGARLNISIDRLARPLGRSHADLIRNRFFFRTKCANRGFDILEMSCLTIAIDDDGEFLLDSVSHYNSFPMLSVTFLSESLRWGPQNSVAKDTPIPWIFYLI